jgi:hypothetical protein
MVPPGKLSRDKRDIMGFRLCQGSLWNRTPTFLLLMLAAVVIVRTTPPPSAAFSPMAVLPPTKYSIRCPKTQISAPLPTMKPCLGYLSRRTNTDEDGGDDTDGLPSRSFSVLKRIKMFFSRRKSKRTAKSREDNNTVEGCFEAAVEEDQLDDTIKTTATITTTCSSSSRQATAADHVDLSGSWRPIVTADFKSEYDEYLNNCSQSFMFRKIVVNAIGTQSERIRMLENGKELEIIATNPAGNWKRTLVASEMNSPCNITIQDPDGDSMVQVEAWWEDGGGTKHKSWLRGKPRVQGGAFETTRYLESKDALICESAFHPSLNADTSMNFQPGFVIWRYKREQEKA